eukprot:g6961.t1
MVPWLRHALLLPTLMATLAATAAAGSGSAGAMVSRTGGGGGGGGGLVEDRSHAAIKSKPPGHADHTSQHPRFRFQRRRAERIRRRKELRESGRRGLEGRNPLAALVEAGDELRARAQRMLRARGGEMQHMLEIRAAGGGLGRRDPLAFGNFLARKDEQNGQEEPLSAKMLALQAENDASVEAVLSVIESDGWEYVTTKSDVVVVRKFMPPPPKASSGGGVVDEGAAAKFACVKAMGTLDADAGELYKLFLDNERVHEYNDNCKEVRDLEQLSRDTKVSWASTPRYGPFKARDFVTAVHYRTLDDGTMMVINRPVEHPAARRGKKYVRAEILIATNIMRPNSDDPAKTDFISVTHINPGGIVDSKLGAKIVNRLCAKAPVNLLVALEHAANSPPVPKPVAERAAKVAG